MKELFLTGGTPITGELRDVEIPTPGEGEVLIKVIATSANPADWKSSKPGVYFNHGHDIAGTIAAVGPGVTEFEINQPVLALHKFFSLHGAYASYSLAPTNLTIPIPISTTNTSANTLTYESASTIPLAAITAGLALYRHLHLPPPWSPTPNPTSNTSPLLIYGASTAVGAFALKLAKLSGYSPIIAVAGAGIPFVESLNIADYIVDYRTLSPSLPPPQSESHSQPTSDKKESKPTLASKLKEILPPGMEILRAFDVISEFTWRSVLECLPRDGRARFTCFYPIDPGTEGVEREVQGINFSRFFSDGVFGRVYPGRGEEEVRGDVEFGGVFWKYIAQALKEGKFTGHPYEVLGGLDQVARGAEMLKRNEVSSKKLVYRIADTPGIDD